LHYFAFLPILPVRKEKTEMSEMIRKRKEKRERRKIHERGPRYYRKDYKCILLYLTEEEREEIKRAAADAGKCMTTYIKEAIDTRMAKEAI